MHCLISIQTGFARLYLISSLIPVRTQLHYYSAVISLNVPLLSPLPPAEEWRGRQQCIVPPHQLLGDFRIMGYGLARGGYEGKWRDGWGGVLCIFFCAIREEGLSETPLGRGSVVINLQG